MKKICAIVLSLAMLLSVTGMLTVSAEGESYKFTKNEETMSMTYYQDFEDVEVMEDYAKTHKAEVEGGDIYGIYSFIGTGGSVMVTDVDPISGEQSVRYKDTLDARIWSIQDKGPLDPESGAYVIEFMIRVDNLPDNGQFTFKISDKNSAEHDSEGNANPILTFKKVDQKLGIYNLTNKLVTNLEEKKAYTVSIVCEVGTENYYVFLDNNYVADSKAAFNVEFLQPSAVRMDLSGSGSIITMDEFYFDGCEISKAEGGGGTSEPTATATATPTATVAATATPTATAKITPKPATPTPVQNNNNDDGFPTWGIVAIVAGVVVVAAAIVTVVMVKKKKK